MPNDKDLIINFPPRYAIRALGYNMWHIEVPAEYTWEFMNLLEKQPWIHFVHEHRNGLFQIGVSAAYQTSDSEIAEALGKLCDHVMNPPLDEEVWDLDN